MNRMEIHRIRIGAPPLACIRPLVAGLAESPAVQYVELPVQKLRERFEEGGLDAALLPPFAALTPPARRVIPGIGLATEQETGCGVLHSRVTLEQISSLHIEPGMEHLRDWLTLLGLPSVSMGEPPEAVLLPEDGAQTMDACPYHYDPGKLWRACTELPMVLFVWVCRPGAPYADMRRIFARALQEGMNALVSPPPHVYYRLGSQEADSLRCLTHLAIQRQLCPPDAVIVYC